MCNKLLRKIESLWSVWSSVKAAVRVLTLFERMTKLRKLLNEIVFCWVRSFDFDFRKKSDRVTIQQQVNSHDHCHMSKRRVTWGTGDERWRVRRAKRTAAQGP